MAAVNRELRVEIGRSFKRKEQCEPSELAASLETRNQTESDDFSEPPASSISRKSPGDESTLAPSVPSSDISESDRESLRLTALEQEKSSSGWSGPANDIEFHESKKILKRNDVLSLKEPVRAVLVEKSLTPPSQETGVCARLRIAKSSLAKNQAEASSWEDFGSGLILLQCDDGCCPNLAFKIKGHSILKVPLRSDPSNLPVVRYDFPSLVSSYFPNLRFQHSVRFFRLLQFAVKAPG
jgi:hypothetical protein